MSLSRVVLLAVVFATGAWAQSTTQASCKAGYEWSYNSKNQDPCTIGSDLDASCRGLAIYTYPPLNSSQYYLPPQTNHTGDLMCDCNMVMYNIYMACSSCQGGEIYPWTSWINQCTNTNTTGYGPTIAQDTVIPHWAFYDATLLPNVTFSSSVAQSQGRDPEVSPNPIPSGSSYYTGTGTNTLLPTKTNTSSGGTNVGAIVGGVIGGIVLLTALALGAFMFTRYRMKKRQMLQSHQQPPMSPMGYPGDYDPSKPPVTYAPPSAPFRPYDPSDPSTFPPQSPPTSVTYTTQPIGARGVYQGAPEV